MRVAFFSSILNHHQLPFCNAMRQIPGVEFTFVQTIRLTEERRAMGFEAMKESFVVNAMEDPEKAYQLCIESDVVIAGVINQDWVNQRVAMGKLTFVYKERFCKEAISLLKPGFWKNGYLNYFRFRNKKLYFLCASAYTARDTRIIFPRPEKKFKWGYFPQVNIHEDPQQLLCEKKPCSILWAGRLLALKHPERCIQVAKELKRAGIFFQMDIVGLGDLESKLKEMIHQENLKDRVNFLGQLPPEQVRMQMGQHQIFLFTSDRQEGWGAVLNEAMSEGCACVASRQAGSTNYLIQDGINGFAYDWDDVDALIDRVKKLLLEQELLKSIQTNALDTIKYRWNAQTAAQRLTEVCEALLKDEEPPKYESGPMS